MRSNLNQTDFIRVSIFCIVVTGGNRNYVNKIKNSPVYCLIHFTLMYFSKILLYKSTLLIGIRSYGWRFG